jgi:hypothetical protein
MLEYRERPKLVEEVQKYKRLKFDSIFLTDEALLTKKIQVEEEKSKIRCLWTQLNFI